MICDTLKFKNTFLNLEDVLEKLKVERRLLRLDETGNLVVGQSKSKIIGRIIDLIEVSEKEKCWSWIGVIASGGYGTCVVFQGRTSAHRAVYMLTVGPIEKNCEICHICDTPNCVNPFHLVEASHQKNVQDSHAKNRSPRLRGEAVKISKLNPELVRSIRRDFENGVSGTKLAKIHNVSHPSVYAVVRNKTWRHV